MDKAIIWIYLFLVFFALVVATIRFSFPFYWLVYSDIRRWVEGKMTLKELLPSRSTTKQEQ